MTAMKRMCSDTFPLAQAQIPNEPMRVPSRIFIYLSIAATAVWLAVSVYEIIGSDATVAAKVNLTAMAIIGAVGILGLGFAVQWVVDYRRRDD